jgi:hypothetical protein
MVGSLAVARHDDLRTNAFDLGYVAQTLWNTAHGQPYRLTVLEGAPFAPEGLDPARIRRPHSYLAFHVEPALLPLAGLYRLWPDPRLLLWLQAAVVALGALPVAGLARHLLGGAGAGLAFGLAWLLAPGLEGAALSDFHLVAFAATWLALGLYCFERGRRRAALASFALAALSSMPRAYCSSSLPPSLSTTPRPVRWNSSAPSSSSSVLTLRLSTGWVVDRRRAARENVPDSATVRKAFSWSSSMVPPCLLRFIMRRIAGLLCRNARRVAGSPPLAWDR